MSIKSKERAAEKKALAAESARQAEEMLTRIKLGISRPKHAADSGRRRTIEHRLGTVRGNGQVFRGREGR